MSKKQLVKMDINFLEYPNWTVAGRDKLKSLIIEKPNGIYQISTTEAMDQLPDRLDKTILYYLLTQRKKNIKVTRYRIAKEVFDAGKGSVSSYYGRIMLALERWASITIKFDGVFYEGDGYSKRIFHIMDNVKLIPKDKRGEELSIRINNSFFKQLEETGFCKYINFEEFRQLRSPVAARMYEVFSKDFKDRDIRKIGIMALAEKLTLDCKYPSEVLRKIKPAIQEINKKTNLKFTMSYDPETQVCTLTLIKSEVKDPFKEGSVEDVKKLLLMLPESLRRQKSVKELVANYHSQKGFHYVYFNILYTLQNAERNKKAYLKKALAENYGEEIQAQMTEAAKIEEERKKREQRNKGREEAGEQLYEQVNRWIKKYGGKEKALYMGNKVLLCNSSIGGLVVETPDGKRRPYPIQEVREEEFSHPKRI